MRLRSVSRGFTVIEFMLAILLGGLVVAVGLAIGYQHAQDANGQELESAIVQVRDLADSAYSQSSGYVTSTGTAVSLPELFSYNNILPLGVVNGATGTAQPTAAQLTNAWGGVFTVGVQSSTATAAPACHAGPIGPANDLLTITVSKLPASTCSHMLGVLAPQMYDTTVNGGLVALSPAPAAGLPGRTGVNYTKAGPLCTEAAAGNTLVFRWLKPLVFAQLRQNPMTTHMTATETACVQPQYDRVQSALTAREAAQAAL